MVGKRQMVMAMAAASAMLVVGCSSSSKSSTGSSTNSSTGSSTQNAAGTSSNSSSGANSPTYTIGLLTDYTGPGASGVKSDVQGVKAGIGVAEQEGYHFKYVLGDTGTSPAQALEAAKKLVEQDHVSAVIMISGVGFAAAPYLTSAGVPVVGSASDGPEWIAAKNMFSVIGALDTTKVSTTAGKFLKSQGVTVLGSIGYGISPSSSENAKAEAISAERQGIKVGYLNSNLAYGTTDMQPTALAMKSAGVDGLTTSVDPNTSFALIKDLRQLGVNLKVALLPLGYGADLLQAGPGGISAGQGVDFEIGYEPVEMHTAATEKFENALRTYGGVSGDPASYQYVGYMSVDLLVQALKAAGPNPSHAALISALSKMTSYDAAGLYGNQTLDLTQRGVAGGPGNCFYVTKLVGSTFQLVPGADPVCGDVIPNVRVHAGS